MALKDSYERPHNQRCAPYKQGIDHNRLYIIFFNNERFPFIKTLLMKSQSVFVKSLRKESYHNRLVMVRIE